MRNNQIDLSGLNDAEIYQMVLTGKIKRFPKNFWMEGKVPSFHPEIIRYLINVICGWVERDEILRNVSQQAFTKNKLTGMLAVLYNGSPIYPVVDAFPEHNFMLWEFNKAPTIWQGEQGIENGIQATKWLFEEKLKWSMAEISEKTSTKVFKEYQLGGMLAVVFDDSIWKCLDTTYPEQFVPWEIGYHMDRDSWTKETAIIATKWLFEDKLKWTQEEVFKNIDAEVFHVNGLGGLLVKRYNNSPFEAVKAAYPNLMLESEMPTKPRGFWREQDNLKLVIRTLILEKLQWDREMVTKKFTGNVLVKNGFATLITRADPYTLISQAFPEWDLKPWELRRSLRFRYWNDETIKTAVKWMIEEKMGLMKEEALLKVKRNHFVEYGLGGWPLRRMSTVKEIIEFVYSE